MKNIQIIDRADNATFSIFQAKDAEFEAIFPDGRDIELAEDFFARLGDAKARQIVERLSKGSALDHYSMVSCFGTSRRRYAKRNPRLMERPGLTAPAAVLHEARPPTSKLDV